MRGSRAPGLGGPGLDPEPPQDPALLEEVSLADVPDLTLPAIERAIADQTGLSVISDFFEDGFPVAIPPAARSSLPLWRLLEAIARDEGDERLIWQHAGPCLTIYHVDWYGLAQREMPEDIVRACREKMDTQGGLSVHDLAEIALLLHDRGLTDRRFPADLRRAGLGGAMIADTWALVLYDSFSAEQLVKACSEEGLSFSELREDQQAWVLYRARCVPDQLPPEQAEDSSLRVTDSVRDVRGGTYRQIEVELEFPQAGDVAVLLLEGGAQAGH